MQPRITSAFNPILLLFAAFLLTSTSSARVDPIGLISLQDPTYSVEQFDDGGAIEYRFKLDSRHFGTLIDQGGAFAFRPHPGCDINGWGSTWYAQPFLPGAELKHTTIESVEARIDGIHASASGKVSRGTADTYGDWSMTIDFSYDPVGQQITGIGQYEISLDDQLDETTGDLNLYKIASNYLDDVPLLSGGTGDTGDMKEAHVRKDSGSVWFIWIPPNQPSHFPADRTDFLSIDVLGQLNEVDTEAQDYEPIAPAFKPSLTVTLSSEQFDVGMMFGGIYDLDKSQDFWTDNVGITPLISYTSPYTEFHFDVLLESVALETCTYLPFVAKP